MGTSNYKVSEQTAKYLNAKKVADTLFASVMGAICNQYGEEQAQELIKPFEGKYCKMIEEIDKLLLSSIFENQSAKDSNTI